MSKIIINNEIDLSDFEALAVIAAVVSKGKISKTKLGKQYCFATSFSKCDVYASLNKSGSNSFRIVAPAE